MKNFMDKMTVFIEEKLNPTFAAFADLPFINAMAKAFSNLMPIMMIGSFATLFSTFTPEWYQNFITNTGIKDVLTVANNLTINITGIWLACSLGYEYANKLGMKKYAFVVVFVSGLAFMMAVRYTTIEGTNYIPFTDLGSRGIFTAMITSVLAVRVYKLCVDKNIYIKMPQGVPVYIQNSFAGIVPGIFIVIIMALLHAGVTALGYDNITALIYSIISTPLKALTGNVVLMTIVLCLPNLFWFFGIHGGYATIAIQPILLIQAMENVAAYAAGEPLPNLITTGTPYVPLVDSFVWTLVLLMSKQERFKTLGKMALVPSLFEVSEPLRFGIPLVLNTYLFLPQMLMGLFNNIATVALTYVGILPRPHSMAQWGFPIFLSSYLQIGVAGIIWSAIVVVIDVIIVLPFFRAYEKSCLEEAQEEK